MRSTNEVLKGLAEGEYEEKLMYMYACDKDAAKKYAERFTNVIGEFCETFGRPAELSLFSAPGRTEIGGNHTDHQHGRVLAAGVNLDVIAAAAPNGTNLVRIKSEGYPQDTIDLSDLEVHEDQYEKAISLIRGVLKRFTEKGYKIEGFDAYTTSNVLKGSGLSSSAAFEVLVGTIINGMFAENGVDAVEIAKIGQYAENVYFGKPSGLMDQMASSVGSVVAIDFADTEKPLVRKVDFNLAKYGYALCIIDSGADHADLTYEYAAIPADMKKIAAYFGKKYLREVDKADFMANLADIRKTVRDDRAVLRAFHFFRDNEFALEETEAIKNNDFDEFLRLNRESGRSSYMYLQNVYPASMPEGQAVAVTLAMCDELLGSRGSYRVHGGGFAGTVQAFVPLDMLAGFKSGIEAVVGKDMCHVLSIRPVGGYELAN